MKALVFLAAIASVALAVLWAIVGEPWPTLAWAFSGGVWIVIAIRDVVDG